MASGVLPVGRHMHVARGVARPRVLPLRPTGQFGNGWGVVGLPRVKRDVIAPLRVLRMVLRTQYAAGTAHMSWRRLVCTVAHVRSLPAASDAGGSPGVGLVSEWCVWRYLSFVDSLSGCYDTMMPTID